MGIVGVGAGEGCICCCCPGVNETKPGPRGDGGSVSRVDVDGEGACVIGRGGSCAPEIEGDWTGTVWNALRTSASDIRTVDTVGVGLVPFAIVAGGVSP